MLGPGGPSGPGPDHPTNKMMEENLRKYMAMAGIALELPLAGTVGLARFPSGWTGWVWVVFFRVPTGFLSKLTIVLIFAKLALLRLGMLIIVLCGFLDVVLWRTGFGAGSDSAL